MPSLLMSAPEASSFLESGISSCNLFPTQPVGFPKGPPIWPSNSALSSSLSRHASAPATFANSPWSIPSIELVTSSVLPPFPPLLPSNAGAIRPQLSPNSVSDDNMSMFGSPCGSASSLENHDLCPVQVVASKSDQARALSLSSSPDVSASKKMYAKRKRGTVVNEIDPETGRRISPVTGKPTRAISKRQWPPKDADRRLWTCPVDGCDLTFGRPSAVHTHMRTHDGAKPFACPITDCRRPFSVFSNLKRHMVVHPTVDFTHVNVKDLQDIRCVKTADGYELVWVDDLSTNAT
ncbi:hypothetical protein OIV83_001095 [Microbotryomycetes sp. JL201]|nr:hypothetical protein OIV83_001095 [Microbotryomycetes sp. JL201]